MTTSQYVVTGKLRQTRYWLVQRGGEQSLYLATGFITSASRFLERSKAQIIADRENGLNSLSGAPIWRGIEWRVEQVQVSLQPNGNGYKVVVGG